MSNRVRTTLVIGALAVSVAVSVWQGMNVVRGVSPDFIARYAAGEMVADGLSPYDMEAHSRYLAVHGVEGLPAWDAPPVMAAFRVAVLLPLGLAAACLTVLSYASVGVLAWFITRRARSDLDDRDGAGTRRNVAIWGLCGMALLQTSGVRHTIALGQTDLLALALVLLFAAWVPALAFLKPQTIGLTAAALFGRAVGVRWPLRWEAIRWGRVLRGALTSAALVTISWVVAQSVRWDDWYRVLWERDPDRQVAPMTYVMVAIGAIVTMRGIQRVRQHRRVIDVVSLAAGSTALLAVNAVWNPQWFLAVLIPLGAIVVPYLLGELQLDRLQSTVLLMVCAASAGDAWVALVRVDPDYHWQVPAVGLAALLLALCLLDVVRPLPAAVLVLLNQTIAHLPLSVSGRTSVTVAAAVGTIYLLLAIRPSGLLQQSEMPNAETIRVGGGVRMQPK